MMMMTMTTMKDATIQPTQPTRRGHAGRRHIRGHRQRRATRRMTTISASTLEEVPGTNYMTLTCEVTKPLGLTLESGTADVGAFVASVNGDGNAAKEKSGIEARDVLTSVNGADTRGYAFDDILDALVNAPGDSVQLTFKRFMSSVNATNPGDRAWLEANSLKEGVTTTPSGLQYRVKKTGTGPGGIGPNTPCECHYSGTLISGKEFDSSYKRGKPLTFAPKQVISGWQEAMRMMREGDEWELFLPSELAYGGRGSGQFIRPGDALLFTMSIERRLE